MDSLQSLLASAKQCLRQCEAWLEAQATAVNVETRWALEECWNAYYTLLERSKSQDGESLIVNLSAYYFELLRLAQYCTIEPLTMHVQNVRSTMVTFAADNPAALDRLTEAEKALAQLPSSSDPNSVPSSPTPRPQKLANDPTAVSAEQLHRILSGYASGMTNHQLMHEIIVDPNFKLQTHQPQSALEERVKSIATQAFFDKLAEDIRSGNAEQSIASIMEDVRKSLLDLAKSSTTLYKQLDDMMDMDLIRQNLSKGTFDLDMMLKDIVQVMLRICAPVRDETIQNISTMDDPVQQLRAILAVLDEMTLDLINFRIRMLRPHLTPMAVEYERSDFAEALAQGKTGLAKTRAWIRNTKQRLDETAVERNKKDRDLSVTAVFEEALVSFITSAEPLSPMTCPETLLLDIHRLSQCQNEIQATSMVASLLLLARNFKVPNHAFDSMAKRFFVLLKDHTTHIDHLSGEIEKHADIDAAHLPLIRSMVDKTLSHDDAVYALLTRRIGTVVRSSISNGQFVDSATLATHGLEHVRRPLRELCQRLIPLARHNFQVYLPWYKEIIME